ncbi:unnamed protein product [Rangifer tarandus platyrhynchus]|uniref:Uncharacterized protein n=2 Tax=Rangifer tarandus platyrhynchus TaxID=3082113 RepID=A0AC59ZZD4_RANTA|nr:unnamed protein product [Rangifer tarandus platyrhynchus]
MIAPLLLSCCSCLLALGCGVSFPMGSNLLLSVVVLQQVATSQKTRARLSTLPSSLLYYCIRIWVKGHSDRNNFISDTRENPLHTHGQGESDRASVVRCYYLETLGEGYTGIICSIFAYSFISNFKMFSKMFSTSVLFFLCPHTE